MRRLRDDDEQSGRLTQLEQRVTATGNVAAIVDVTQAVVKNGQDTPGVIVAVHGAL